MKIRSLTGTFLVLAISLLLAGCGGSTTTSSSLTPGSVPVSLTIGDTPPSGVSVLSFEIEVTGAVLQQSGNTVSLLNSPTDIELSNLQTGTTLLNTGGAPAGTYQSIQVTFANAELTIQNNSGATIAGCANGQVCELKPSISQATATYSGAPFPLTLTANSPTGLALDFNLDQSIQGDLSISPSISFTQLQATSESEGEQLDHFDDLSGTVMAVGNNQLTLQNASGKSFVIGVDSNTQYEDFGQSGCTASNFSCLAQNQNLEVSVGLMSGGALVAKEIQLEGDNNAEDLEGVVVSITSPTQFNMVVLDEIPDITGIQVGNPITVTIQSGATFQVDNNIQLNIPSTDGFASAADLMVGQEVQVRRISTGSTGTTVATDQLTLKPSEITASVDAIQSSSAFTINNLPGLFINATPSVGQISVLTSSGTTYEDVSGVGGLSSGDSVSVKGLLYKTVTTPEVPDLVAEQVRKR